MVPHGLLPRLPPVQAILPAARAHHLQEGHRAWRARSVAPLFAVIPSFVVIPSFAVIPSFLLSSRRDLHLPFACSLNAQVGQHSHCVHCALNFAYIAFVFLTAIPTHHRSAFGSVLRGSPSIQSRCFHTSNW